MSGQVGTMLQPQIGNLHDKEHGNRRRQQRMYMTQMEMEQVRKLEQMMLPQAQWLGAERAETLPFSARPLSCGVAQHCHNADSQDYGDIDDHRNTSRVDGPRNN